MMTRGPSTSPVPTEENPKAKALRGNSAERAFVHVSVAMAA